MGLGGAPANAGELPDGIVTFLLTDIEGSAPLWETDMEAMSTALARHERLIAKAVASHSGQLIKSRGEGDSTLSVFVRAPDAVAAALAHQQALAIERWPEDLTLPTRVALHSGEAELRDGDYYGQAVNRAADCGRWPRADTSCSPKEQPNWWPTSCHQAQAWPMSASTT
jgi:class 3 adenylate cyclase